MRAQEGQSIIEYLFLMIVLVALFYSFFSSQFLQNYSNELFGAIGDNIRFSYHHGAGPEGRTYVEPNYDGGPHPTYYKGGDDSHFFISHEEYP